MFFESSQKNELVELTSKRNDWRKLGERVERNLRIQVWMNNGAILELTEGFSSDEENLSKFQTRLLSSDFSRLMQVLDQINQRRSPSL